MKTTEQKNKGKAKALPKEAPIAKAKSDVIELLANAEFRAGMLTRALREAHSVACRENGLLAMVLLSRLETASCLQRKLENIRSCVNS